MIVTYTDLPFPAMGSGLQRSDDPNRPHLTTLIRDIGRRLNLMPDYTTSSNQWDLPMAGDIGFMWEDALSHVMAERMCQVVRLGEVEVDGIVGSPDGIGDDPLGFYNAALYEYKITWKSSRNLPQDNWYWLTQTKCYCHMLGLRCAILMIGYINGDYKGSGPTYREARIEYEGREVREAWRMVVEYAAEKRGEVDRG